MRGEKVNSKHDAQLLRLLTRPHQYLQFSQSSGAFHAKILPVERGSWKRGEQGLMLHGGEASLMGVLGRVLRRCNIFKPHALLMSWLQLMLVVVLVLLRLPRLRYQYRLQLRAVPCATWVSRTTI